MPGVSLGDQAAAEVVRANAQPRHLTTAPLPPERESQDSHQREHPRQPAGHARDLWPTDH